MGAPFDPAKIEQILQALEKKSAELDAFLVKAGGDLASNADAAKKALADAEQTAKEVKGLAARLVELEQKAVESVFSGKTCGDTAGAMFVKSEKFKGFAANDVGGKLRVDVKNTLTLAMLGATAGAQNVVAPPLPALQVGVIDLLPMGTTASPVVNYAREVAITDNTAVVAEGAAKPYSGMTFDPVSASIPLVATLIKATKLLLDDAPALQSYIDARLRLLLRRKAEKLVVSGLGDYKTGGLLLPENHVEVDAAVDETAMDLLNRAKYGVWASGFAPSAYVLNPADVSKIETAKGSDGHYVYGRPDGLPQLNLWGLPVVPSIEVPVGKYICGAFNAGAQLWERQGDTIEISTENDDDFEKNLITIRGEARRAMTVYAPSAFVAGDLPA